jgi:hypothetical protein
MIVGANQFRLAAGKRVVSGFQTGVIFSRNFLFDLENGTIVRASRSFATL